MTPEQDGGELLTTSEVSREWKVARQSIARWADEGLLPVAAATPGGNRRYRRSEVEAFFAPKESVG